MEAISDASLIPGSNVAKSRAGVAVGSGIASMEDLEEGHQTFITSGAKKLSPYFIPKILINTAAGHISIKYGLQGPNHAVSTACATGAHAIGDAARFIASDFADVMIAGSTEAAVTPLTVSGFARARALSTNYQQNPERSSRPFDVDRDGFVIGEGAGVMVLEEMEHALKRGAQIYGEVRGYGLAGDAYHLTAPCPNGTGALAAMTSALAHSGLDRSDIGYINAHATSTPLGDKVESKAIRQLFGEDPDTSPYVSSTKGAIGHLLGAAGSVEAIFTLLALKEGVLPPTLNLDNVDPDCKLRHVPNKAIAHKARAAMTNSFGFGGTNASLVLSIL
jgi:3-oxoacyl-[acyl-carrier-protein] synthase II